VTTSARKSARSPSPRTSAFGENLPKTRSGKIMRRLLRSIAKNEAITQDTSDAGKPGRSWISWAIAPRPTFQWAVYRSKTR
jgi:hypothetical protein